MIILFSRGRVSRKECIASGILILLAIAQLSIVNASDTVDVWPGNYHKGARYDYRLGKDFPTEDTVKLDYPKSTILTNITGELVFNVTLTTYNYTSETRVNSIVKTISIYVSPEFIINNKVASIWTSFTNDYSRISLSTASYSDPIAPGWSIIRISNLNISKPHSGFNNQTDVRNKVFLENRTQYIRIFNVTSPTIAGRYFFKVFITFNGLTHSIGASNFPTLVVKSALNPAYVSGVVRYGGSCHPNSSYLYGLPLDSSYNNGYSARRLLPNCTGGKVYAEGLTSEGKKVFAKAYFNATAGGRFTIYGLAPATYNLTISAAGYPPRKFLNAVTVVRGQSMDSMSFHITDGANITGTVYSKHVKEKIPWGHVYNLTNNQVNRTIRIDITDLNEKIIASSPLRLYDKPLLKFLPRDTLNPSSNNYNFSIMREVSFDGHIPQDYANYTSGIPSGDYYIKAFATNYVQLDPLVVHTTNNTCHVKAEMDLQRTSYFEVTVHFKNIKGDANVMPIYTRGYLYLEVLDETDAVVGFNISLVPAGVSKFTMQVRGVDIWNKLALDATKRIAWALSHDRGLLPGTYTINALFMNRSMDFIAINALIVASPEARMAYPTTTTPLVQTFTPQTLELTNRQTPLYFQLEVIKASIGSLCNSPVELSYDLVLAGGFNITLYSINWQNPPNYINWAYPGSRIRVNIQTTEGDLIDTIYSLQPLSGSNVDISTIGKVGLKSGEYILKLYTPGYIEDQTASPITIQVTLGAISDKPINLLKGAIVNLTITFKTEQLPDPINNKLLYARPINNIDATPVRIEMFDDLGEFVAANRTYVRKGSNYVEASLYGFDSYHGNPRILWTNFHDTTDGNSKYDYGIDEGKFQIRVNIAGYHQAELLQIMIDSGDADNKPNVSLITSVERLGYLYGNISWVNWQRILFPLSWASITAYHGNGFKETYTFSLDSFYEMWLVAEEYDFGIHHPGLGTEYLRHGLHVTWGSSNQINFLMNERIDSEVDNTIEEIPEFRDMILTLFLSISVLVLLLRFRSKALIINSKPN